ncbi:cytochrome c3 family protein [Beggiatoa alba]|nr:cytochrome c3 family protein [Beggiatoa alba]
MHRCSPAKNLDVLSGVDVQGLLRQKWFRFFGLSASREYFCEGRIVLNLASVVGLAVLLVSLSATAATDHVCSDCHASATPSASDLIRPLSGLCVDCHRNRIIAGEHIIDVPVIASSNTLPLHSVMTCAPCHDPHQPFAALRWVDPELCRHCHVK